MKVQGNRLLVSQTSLNRIFYGTHQPWEVLCNEGATLLVRGPGGAPTRLSRGKQPGDEIMGVDLLDEQLRFLTPLRMAGVKFVTSVPTTGERFCVKECRIPGNPNIVLAVDPSRA